MERSNGAVKTACDVQVDGKRGPGMPKMTWKQLTERDCRDVDPHDRHTWRQRGLTDLDVSLVPAPYSDIR